jgi:asparagine synthase (glutamine-hydrolysing)
VCGIAGVVLRDGPAPTDQVQRQLDLLVHRGPDACGIHAGGRGAVGQTRLSVIDLVTGDPPISTEDGSVGAVLNGEIYNYRELRDELRRGGHGMRTQGDTEVIAHLAEGCTPVELARRLDGMFAFAVWDTGRDRLVLGRDRVGKKPLYYWAGPGCFVFASELKAVLAHPAVPRRLDADAIPAYLAFGYVPTPRTFFDDVQSLPPGHVLSLLPGEPPVVERYWEPPLATAGELGGRLVLSFDEAAAEVRRRVTAAIERRLVADVPVGAFLSGGVDSASVVALLSTIEHGAKVATFTIGFEDNDGFDERPFAREVARRFGTDHEEFVVRPDAAALVERLLWHHDQPFGDSSALPTYLLCEMTRQHVTVALSGDGGDEAFAGYERFSAAVARQHLDRVPPAVVGVAGRAAALVPPRAFRGRAASIQRLLARPGGDLLGTYLDWVGPVSREWRDRLVGQPAQSSGWKDAYAATWEASAGAPLVDRLLDLNLRTYLVDDLLPKMDRMSMAHGLEVRSPFLDADLLAFTARLPPEMKLRGFSRKRVLKRAMRDLLPASILNRRKRGFGIPLARWFQEDLAPLVHARLGAPDARVREHLHGPAVDALIAEHARTGTAEHALWTLLTLELFLRREGW